jgi:hypothetical protein
MRALNSVPVIPSPFPSPAAVVQSDSICVRLLSSKPSRRGLAYSPTGIRRPPQYDVAGREGEFKFQEEYVDSRMPRTMIRYVQLEGKECAHYSRSIIRARMHTLSVLGCTIKYKCLFFGLEMSFFYLEMTMDTRHLTEKKNG